MNTYQNFSKPKDNNQFDVVVVGSGPAGVHAAYPLIKAGLKVVIIDGGLDSKKKDDKLNEFPEAKLTKTGHYYSLIEKSSHVFNKTFELLRIKSNVEIIQSLAKGGLSEVWHGICDHYSKSELEMMGLPSFEIKKEYQEVGKLIKLKVNKNLDFHNKLILAASIKKTHFKNKIYHVPLAFPYRTSSVIEYLKRFENFTYIPHQLVYIVEEKEKQIEIKSFPIRKLARPLIIKTKFLILAAGSINTTRILLRSLGLFNYKTTFLTKAHYLTACLHLRTLAKKNNHQNLNVGQLAIFSEGIFTQLYELKSVVLHKVFKYIPLPKLIALPLLSTISSSLVIADIRFSDYESKNKFCRLIKNSNGADVLEIFYKESGEELKIHKNEFNKISRQLRSLGLFPLKSIYGHITSHYAGGVPFQKKAGKLSVDENGKLHQANKIYVADSSTWRALPSKPPTLTIMANASRVGKNVLKDFRQNKS